MIHPTPLYIFCGGGSRRLGRDKALIELDGETLLERQVRRAFPFFDQIILLSGSNHYDTPNRQIPDVLGNAGPLSGLLAALKDAELHHQQIAVIPVDVPFLADSTMKILSEYTLSENTDAATLCAGEVVQPLAGLYKCNISANLQQWIDGGQRMVMKFLEQLHLEHIRVMENELRNINFPGDVEKFIRM